jgi:hypothetical protein
MLRTRVHADYWRTTRVHARAALFLAVKSSISLLVLNNITESIQTTVCEYLGVTNRIFLEIFTLFCNMVI